MNRPELQNERFGDYPLASQQEVSRTSKVPTLTEPMAFVACREITNWASRCRKFKMPFFSEENWSAGALGISIGLAAAAWAGDFSELEGRKEVLIGGSIIAFALAVIFATMAISKRRKSDTDLGTLAAEMEGARDAGRVKDEPDSAPASPVDGETGEKPSWYLS